MTAVNNCPDDSFYVSFVAGRYAAGADGTAIEGRKKYA